MATFLFAAVLAALPVEVQRLDGSTVDGPLTQLTAESVAVEAADGPATISLDKVASVSLKSPPQPSSVKPEVWTELNDGSKIVGTRYTAQNGQATVAAIGQQTPLIVPTRAVRCVRLQAENEALAAQWAKILEGRGATDTLVTRKENNLDFHQGLVLDVTADAVQFKVEEEVIPVKRTKVYGLIYGRTANEKLAAPAAIVFEASGSVWSAESVVLTGENFRWTTPSGVSLSCPAASIARLDYSRGKIVYLSDQKPESSEWTPYLQFDKQPASRVRYYEPRSDRNHAGDPLSLDGRGYKKGVSIHSRAVVVYRLPGEFSRFTAVAGIDDSVRPRGHVRLVIRGDDKVLFDAGIGGNDPPVPLDLDVRGARRLTILVDLGNGFDENDFLDLCDARFVK